MGSRHWLAAAGRAQLTSWRTRIWAGLLVILALLLCQVPLLGVLGFEFALAMAVAASVAAVDLGAALVWRARALRSSPIQQALSPGRVVVQLWAWATLQASLLLLPPLVIVSCNAFWVRNCDWLFGIRCFLLMSVLSATFASGVGVVSGLAAGRRRWLRIALPYTVLIASVVFSVIQFYRAPAVFSYNPFAGYFPGNLYDESIDLRAPFYWARLYHFSLLALLGSIASLFLHVSSLCLQRKPRPSFLRVGPLAALVLSAALALALHLQSGALRFAVAAQDVRAALSGRFESEHFIIHYSADPHIAENIEVIAADHEFRRAQLVRDFDVDPPGKIRSYYFASPDEKHELMGARNVYMAKPWRHEIYLNQQGFPHQVLRHEIAHVMAGAFGDRIFEVSAGHILGLPILFNGGMIEGTAVAGDWPNHFDKALTPHQNVKAMQILEMAPPVDRLFSTGFLAFSSSRGYTVAGSYLRFLMDRYGMDRLRQLYRSGGDFERAYGRSQDSLDAEWRQLIADTSLPEDAPEIIREQFRRPAIFHRPCAHALARSRRRMLEQAAGGNFREAIGTAREMCRDVPGEPRYQLQLAALLTRSGDLEEAARIYERIGHDAKSTSSSLRARALFALVGLKVAARDMSRAESLLQTTLELPLGDDNMRQAQVLYRVLRHTGPAAEALRSIFWASHPGAHVDPLVVAGLAAEAAHLEPDLGLAHYLLGRRLRGRGDPDATRRALLRALQRDLSPLVEREAARMLAEAAFLAGKYDQVLRAAAILVEPGQPEVTRLLGYDWYERVQWTRTGTLADRPLGWRDSTTQSGPPAGLAPPIPAKAKEPAKKPAPAQATTRAKAPEPAR